MTIESLLQNSDLKEKFVLQKLICYFLDYTKEEMWLNVTQEISTEEEQKILAAYYDIADNQKPLEYTLGFVEFFKRKFYVNEHTLIPRPETEYMIKAVTEEIDRLQMADNRWQETTCELQTSDDGGQGAEIGDLSSKFCLLDIGTGCGVLGTSVLLQNPGFFCKALFTDVSEKALEVAQQNYEILIKDHDFHVEFIQSDLLEFIASHPLDPKSPKHIVLVANLPYIPEKTFDKNVADNVKKREPKMAFVAGDDGLIYYRKMLDQIIQMTDSRLQKTEDGVLPSATRVLFLEMMTRQIDILRQEYKEKFNFEEVKTFHFNIRIVKATLK